MHASMSASSLFGDTGRLDAVFRSSRRSRHTVARSDSDDAAPAAVEAGLQAVDNDDHDGDHDDGVGTNGAGLLREMLDDVVEQQQKQLQETRRGLEASLKRYRAYEEERKVALQAHVSQLQAAFKEQMRALVEDFSARANALKDQLKHDVVRAKQVHDRELRRHAQELAKSVSRLHTQAEAEEAHADETMRLEHLMDDYRGFDDASMSGSVRNGDGPSGAKPREIDAVLAAKSQSMRRYQAKLEQLQMAAERSRMEIDLQERDDQGAENDDDVDDGAERKAAEDKQERMNRLETKTVIGHALSDWFAELSPRPPPATTASGFETTLDDRDARLLQFARSSIARVRSRKHRIDAADSDKDNGEDSEQREEKKNNTDQVLNDMLTSLHS